MSRREENAVMAAVAEADAMADVADATVDVAGAMADVADAMADVADATEIAAAEVAHEPGDVTETEIADATGIGIATEVRGPKVAETEARSPKAAAAAARRTTDVDAARL